MEEISEKLSVNYIVEGAVKIIGDNLRVNVTLFDIAKNNSLWSESYNNTLHNILNVQDEIASSIVKKLDEKLTITKVDIRATERKSTENLEAYNLYSKATLSLSETNIDGTLLAKQTIPLLKKAIELDLPRQWILNDQTLIKIAKTKPSSLDQLNKLGIDTRSLEAMHQEQILKIISQNLNGTERSKAPSQKKRKLHPNPNLLKDFSKCINAKALELNIPSDVLASKKDCLSLLQDTNNSRLLNGWRKKVIGEKLVKLLSND